MTVNISSTSNDIVIRISAVDETETGFASARANMRKTGDATDSMQARMGASFKKIQAHWLAATAVITSAIIGIKKAWEYLEIYAQFEEMRAGLNGLAAQYGMTGQAAINMAKQAVAGQLSMMDAGQLAGKAFMLGFNPDQVKAFLEQAEKLTDIVGGKIPDAFEAMEKAIITGRATTLAEYGLVVDFSTALQDYARKHGIAVKQIDDHTERQIRLKAVMEAAQKATANLSGEVQSLADHIGYLSVQWEDFKVKIGEFTARTVYGLMGAFLMINAEFTKFIGVALKGLELFAGALDKVTFGKFKVLGDAAKTIRASAEWEFELSRKAQLEAAKNFKIMTAPAEAHKKILNSIPPAYEAIGNSSENASQKTQKAEEERLKNLYTEIDLIQRVKKEQAKATDEMLKKFHEYYAERERKQLEEAEKEREAYRQNREMILKDEEAALARQKENYQNAWQNIMDMANQIGGEAGAGMGQMVANLKGITDIFGGQDEYARQEQAVWDHWSVILTSYAEGYSSLDDLHVAAVNRDAQLESIKKNQTLAIASSGFGMMAGLAKSFYALSGQENKKAFEVYKSFAIAQAVVDTFRSAQSAYAAMSGIFPAPLWGVLAAAAAVAAGMANVQAIRSQQPGGTAASTSPSAGGGGGYSFTNPTEPIWENTQAKKESEKTPSRVMNVYIQGDIVTHDQLARDIIPSLEKAWGDKVGEQ